MRFNKNTRSQIYVDMELDFDPTGTAVELEIDGATYAGEWQGTPAIDTRGQWAQTFRTTGYFAGPDVDSGLVGAAVVLALGEHESETRVTSGGTILAEDSSTIDVR